VGRTTEAFTYTDGYYFCNACDTPHEGETNAVECFVNCEPDSEFAVWKRKHRCRADSTDECVCCPTCWTPQGDEAIATNGCEDDDGCGYNRFMDPTIPKEPGA
jgi:hypothetical protein